MQRDPRDSYLDFYHHCWNWYHCAIHCDLYPCFKSCSLLYKQVLQHWSLVILSWGVDKLREMITYGMPFPWVRHSSCLTVLFLRSRNKNQQLLLITLSDISVALQVMAFKLTMRTRVISVDAKATSILFSNLFYPL